MDPTGVLGIVASIAIMMIWGLGDPANIPTFIDLPSVAIVGGCSMMCMVCAYPPGFWKTVPGFFKMYIIVQKHNLPLTISSIIGFAEQARREGILALENSLENVSDPFLRKGIQLAVDGTERAVIENVLEIEKDSIEARHKDNISFFENLGAMGPAFGMLGTLIGLVLMLKNMSDPSAIGPAMAIALITTFYGSLLANVVAWPIATKLKIRHGEEMVEKQVMLEGILAVQAGENPRVVQWKLAAYLDPVSRAELEAAKEKERSRRDS
ncbi:MAG: MotA/TolQ/ExbB proton channel family protein [Fibromonadaceae bacterium]|jgi:chemotaxis protein MotA|nr:MotA/TolQ/ExbB proton channel family protein [Fibromonadaceae bacterium]